MTEAQHAADGEALEHPAGVGVLAAFLQSGRVLDHASSVMLVATLLALRPFDSLSLALFALATVGALAEKYFAWRVTLDAGLFAVLQRHPDDAAAFDAALAHVLGRQPGDSRSMASRWQGARRLLWRQGMCLALQTAAAVAFLVLTFAGPFAHPV